MHWVTLAVALLSCVHADRFNVQYVWSDGYNAECRIEPLTNDISGWSIHFKFDQPMHYVEVYNTKLVYHTDREWIIESKPESHHQAAGHILAVNFTVRHQHTTQPILGSYIFHTKGWTIPLWIPRREISYRSRNADGTIRESIQMSGHVRNNARVCLVFDHPVTYVKVPTGEVVFHAEREWIIQGHSNQHSDLEFIVYPSGDMPVTGVYYIEDEGCLSLGEHAPSRISTPLEVWDGGYKGGIHVQVPVSVKSWRVRFQFDKPIEWLEVFGATYLNHFNNKFEWVVGSEANSSHLNPGETYTFWFIVRQYGSNPTLGLYTIIPEPIDANVTMKYNYGEVLRLSTLFYNAQRSGKLPANNTILWRGDSALFDGDNGRDLTGGWYNDGGHVKTNLPMAYSTWLLEWGMLKFPDSYVASGQLDAACDMIKWPLEYLLKSWIPERNILYVQVGDKSLDNANWLSPEVMNMWRPAFSVNSSCPGSDVAANTVSAFAAGYLLFKDACHDTSFADKLLLAAESLYTFARAYRGVYSNCVKQPATFYRSTDDSDDLTVAAMWMYRTKYESRYLNDAIQWFPSLTPDTFSWDDTSVAAALLLYEATHGHQYETYVNTFLTRYMSSGDIPYTHCGLAWRDKWGPNRYAANAAFIAIMAAEMGLEQEHNTIQWAMSQIHYILGDNKQNESYVIGFGSSFPRRPHHRGSSCSKLSVTCSYLAPGANMNTLLGALVSGPDIHDDYIDRRTNYIQNAVACEYNAGFQSAVAGLLSFAQKLKLPTAPVPKC